MLNKIILDQLNLLKTLEFQVDGKPSKDFPESFSEIVFKCNNTANLVDNNMTFIFEDYFVKPYEGFDFHKKFNNNIPPPYKEMQGSIIKETEKMIYIKVINKMYGISWEGWCPRKCVKIM